MLFKTYLMGLGRILQCSKLDHKPATSLNILLLAEWVPSFSCSSHSLSLCIVAWSWLDFTRNVSKSSSKANLKYQEHFACYKTFIWVDCLAQWCPFWCNKVEEIWKNIKIKEIDAWKSGFKETRNQTLITLFSEPWLVLFYLDHA